MIRTMLRNRFAAVFQKLFPVTLWGVFTAIMLKVALSLRANRNISPPTVSSTTEVVTDEATCLQELSDAEETYGPYSQQLSSAIRKLSDFYQKSGESAKLENSGTHPQRHDCDFLQLDRCVYPAWEIERSAYPA
jgi:hypothetical protein